MLTPDAHTFADRVRVARDPSLLIWWQYA